MGEATEDDAGPTLTTNRWGPPTRLRFESPQRPWDDDIIDYLVTVESQGLSAKTPVTSLGGDGLPSFLEELASQFCGWTGVRTWRSMEDQLRVEATWKNGGHVSLCTRIRPSVHETWDLAIEFTVEAGAEMQSLATELECFFAACD